MKDWNRLFIRHGFMVEEKSLRVFDCIGETEKNMDFLLEGLEKLSIQYSYENDTLTINDEPISEDRWIKCLDFKFRGRGEGLWFRPGQEEPKIRELDTYIAGVIRQLNRLGLHTNICCDGHEKTRPSIGFAEWVEMDKVSRVFQAIGIGRFFIRNRYIRFNIERKDLLDLAEKLKAIQKDWLMEEIDFIKKQLFLQKLDTCLSIKGESGSEERIREYVMDTIKPFVDYITEDRYGNILAETSYGTGQGPTILLNSHLDTVDIFEDGRVIFKEDGTWSSSNGILGADDRAGVAVLLELAERLQTIRFNGKVKWIFTVEEEIGLNGARNVDEYFLWGTHAAIVVDRRGNGDIVTSCGGYFSFCDERYGEFIEEVARNNGMEDWKCTSGGSSDTRIWASHGIQSVNLSVGYQNEHTSAETLDTDACYRTVKLIEGIFQSTRELNNVLRTIQRRGNTLFRGRILGTSQGWKKKHEA
ncbi:M20/M25/M40 family metallo-hydrolase [Bacillus massilinigeriensis]|uniref:M20/M25/M40 family metallo-hydrolase n=1 Tax=Bacillus massilionigeriensis TaxID=1805475 RepID=UPI00096B66BD|nr:M20/M25/M40 family metallo-hydrolase [Bacillus massilionigeriensis]